MQVFFKYEISALLVLGIGPTSKHKEWTIPQRHEVMPERVLKKLHPVTPRVKSAETAKLWFSFVGSNVKRLARERQRRRCENSIVRAKEPTAKRQWREAPSSCEKERSLPLRDHCTVYQWVWEAAPAAFSSIPSSIVFLP